MAVAKVGYSAAGGTEDAWNNMAKSYGSLTVGRSASTVDVTSPTTPPAVAMLNLVNDRRPWSQATSYLDTGCGPGVVVDLLVRDFGAEIPESAVLRAADFSTVMIEQVKEKKAKEIERGNKIWQRVQADVQDAQELQGVEDNSVSHVTGNFVFLLVPDPRKALEATYRVLTDKNGGGVLGLTSWHSSEWMDVMGVVSDVRPDKDPFPIPKVWRSSEGVKSELEAAGYRDVQTVEVESYMEVQDHHKTVRFFLEKLPHLVMYQKDMSKDECEQLERLMMEKIKSLCPVAPGILKGTAIVAVASK